MKVLVTGGAGYIGSFTTRALLDRGDEVIVADSLERGHEDFVDNRAKFLQGNLTDKRFVSSIFNNQNYDAVIHFAGFISMGESMKEPGLYFLNNTFSSINLLEEMAKTRNNNFIFSSSAGVYGNPTKIPIPEEHPTNPENPYGESKLMVEKILKWYFVSKGINSVALRYFNAAGASLDGNFGERHSPETHLIPNVISSILEDKSFTLFGTDYKTKDGTCVRDYIHVLDLASAHLLAIDKLKNGSGAHVYNVGTGNGYSIKEVIKELENVSGKTVKVAESDRRPGDADELIADPSKIKKELSFEPKYSDLETIVKTAWQWQIK